MFDNLFCPLDERPDTTFAVLSLTAPSRFVMAASASTSLTRNALPVLLPLRVVSKRKQTSAKKGIPGEELVDHSCRKLKLKIELNSTFKSISDFSNTSSIEEGE